MSRLRGINLGSGQKPFRSTGEIQWLNVDINPKWEPDIVADAASMPMFADGSMDYIVSQHSIEHVGLGEYDAVIRECHRVLRVGGQLIVTTPNLRALVYAWQIGRISDYIFCVNLYGAYMDSPSDYHRWTYTPQTLAETVGKAARWAEIYPCAAPKAPGADIAADWWIQGLVAVR